MAKSYFFYLSFFVIIAFASCSSYKKINYFQDLDRSKDINQKIDNYSPLTIQPGDILGITVSSLSPEGSAIFNNSAGGGAVSAAGGAAAASASGGGAGYLVDQKGEIQLPLINAVKVDGLTTYDAQKVLKKYLVSYLKEPNVTIRILNFKFSVLGDVARPGIFVVPSDRITLPEALSEAGDLTITAKRNNILLIREIDGVRKFVSLDINSSELFKSPYYYLKNNDVLYIEADRAKYAPVSPINRNLPLVLSTLSLIIGVVGIIEINKN